MLSPCRGVWSKESGERRKERDYSEYYDEIMFNLLLNASANPNFTDKLFKYFKIVQERTGL